MKPKLNAECQKNRTKRLKSKGEHENMLIWAYTFITNKITRNFNMVLQCAIHNSNKYFILFLTIFKENTSKIESCIKPFTVHMFL